MHSYAKDYFNAESMGKISRAAANLYVWVVAIVQYNAIYKDVAPKMAAAKEAEGEHATAMTIFTRVEEKNAVERDTQACQDRMELAERLVSGLADENAMCCCRRPLCRTSAPSTCRSARSCWNDTGW